MSTTPHIAVLGATGRTGICIVEQALARGWRVTALVRHPDPAHEPPEGLRIAQANMHDPGALESALHGDFDAVISALGLFPRSPSTELSEGTSNVLSAMAKNDLRRLILISSFGCGGTDRQAPLLLRLFAFKYLFRHTIPDKNRQEELVRNAPVEHTILRPTGLYDGAPVGKLHIWNDEKPAGVKRFKSSRADVARIALDAVEDRSMADQTLMMSE